MVVPQAPVTLALGCDRPPLELLLVQLLVQQSMEQPCSLWLDGTRRRRQAIKDQAACNPVPAVDQASSPT